MELKHEIDKCLQCHINDANNHDLLLSKSNSTNNNNNKKHYFAAANSKFNARFNNNKSPVTNDEFNNKNNTTTNLVINVYLLAECCYNELIGADSTSASGHNLILSSYSKSSEELFSAELLERWNISMITNNNNNNNSGASSAAVSDNSSLATTHTTKSLVNMNDIFQAIRSYLHFSQISSWINQSRGKEPKHLAFR